jgi:hypothetical protein
MRTNQRDKCVGSFCSGEDGTMALEFCALVEINTGTHMAPNDGDPISTIHSLVDGYAFY